MISLRVAKILQLLSKNDKYKEMSKENLIKILNALRDALIIEADFYKVYA